MKTKDKKEMEIRFAAILLNFLEEDIKHRIVCPFDIVDLSQVVNPYIDPDREGCTTCRAFMKLPPAEECNIYCPCAYYRTAKNANEACKVAWLILEERGYI